MLDVITAGAVTDDYVDFIAADLRFTDSDQRGPLLASTSAQRAEFPVVVIGCGEAGLLADIKLKQAGIPFTIVEKQDGPGAPGAPTAIPAAASTSRTSSTRTLRAHRPLDPPVPEQPEIPEYLTDVMDRHDIGPDVRFDTTVTEGEVGRRCRGGG